MKSRSILTLTGIILAVFLTAQVVDASGKEGCTKCQKMMKEVKFKVTNTENGVVVVATSDNPDAVAFIQKKFASFAKPAAKDDTPKSCPKCVMKDTPGKAKEGEPAAK